MPSSRIQANTRKYARKQLTWFKKDQEWQWFHPEETEKIIEFATGETMKNFETYRKVTQ